MTTCDPVELARLRAKLVALQDLRDSGVLSIREPEGRSISFQSSSDLRAAIAELQSEINELCGVTEAPRRTRIGRFFQSGTGY